MSRGNGNWMYVDPRKNWNQEEDEREIEQEEEEFRA